MKAAKFGLRVRLDTLSVSVFEDTVKTVHRLLAAESISPVSVPAVSSMDRGIFTICFWWLKTSQIHQEDGISSVTLAKMQPGVFLSMYPSQTFV